MMRRTPTHPKREPTQSTYRPDMAPSKAVMRRIDNTSASSPTTSAPTATRRGASGHATQDERNHLGRVAALGCLLCHRPAQVHHLRYGHGMSQRASHWLTMPLCEEHHTGSRGIHGDRSALRAANITELDLLAMTIERLHRSRQP